MISNIVIFQVVTFIFTISVVKIRHTQKKILDTYNENFRVTDAETDTDTETNTEILNIPKFFKLIQIMALFMALFSWISQVNNMFVLVNYFLVIYCSMELGYRMLCGNQTGFNAIGAILYLSMCTYAFGGIIDSEFTNPFTNILNSFILYLIFNPNQMDILNENK